MTPSIIMHVNYVEQGQTISEMCQRAVAFGYDGIEFRRRRRTVSEDTEDYLAAIAKAVKATGLKQVIFGFPGPDLAQPDAARRAADLDLYERFFRSAARLLPLTVCNTHAGLLNSPDKNVSSSDYDRHGSAAASPQQWQWAAEGFHRLGLMAAELGFRFAFETHMHFVHDLPAAACKLVDMIGLPSVGVNLDFGNTVYFKTHPTLAEVITSAGPRIFYTHLKNSIALPDGSRQATGLGEGDINHREYLRLLQSIGYSGPLCVEAPRAGDREWFARQDFFYISGLLHDVQWK